MPHNAAGTRTGQDPPDPVYRGIPVGHHAWEDAVRGVAKPGRLNGHADPDRHNAGDTRTSRFTSWTYDRDVAEGYAGPGGIVLVWRTGKPPAGATWEWAWSPDPWREQEVLIAGVLEGAEVIRL